eukprot:TRINITY_DN3296_c0_g1_i1.p1 TRINITY_DN3296_c0_g1~~TRINITY_DN3296_c0_g1_i1.p1  ORF type:complete len:444 (-),score=94.01 TRINITY_DN3296_c0_g1_i1:21-1352(-)
MNRPSLFILLILLASVLCDGTFDKTKLKGVSPQDAKLYKGSQFTCKDGSKTLAASYINDDYCDCLDGSDEPGTSACPNGVFHCRNIGYIGIDIPSSRVGDRICDCCDGSDERDVKVATKNWFSTDETIQPLCPNSCGNLARIWRQEQEQQLALHQEGLEVRAKHSADALVALDSHRQELEQEKSKAAALEEERIGAQGRHSTAEEQEKLVQQVQDKIKEEEERVKAEQEAEAQETLPQEIEPTLPVEEVEEEEEEEEEEEDVPTPEPEEDDNSELGLLKKATKKFREELSEVENRIRDNKRRVDELEELLRTDFGTDNQFFYMKGQCYEADTPEYIYELCPFDKVTQKPKSGSPTSLGTWSKEGNTEWTQTHQTMMYTGGVRCWGGPDRSAKITLYCNRETKLSDVNEPNKCEYTMRLGTPAACSPAQVEILKKSLSPVHDEL